MDLSLLGSSFPYAVMEILARIKDFVYGRMKCTGVGFRHYITQRAPNQKYTYYHSHHSAQGPRDM